MAWCCLGGWNEICNFQANFSDWCLRYHLLWNCAQMSLYWYCNKSTLVQVRAWCHQATSHYLSQYWPRPMSPYDVTNPNELNFPQQLPIQLLKFSLHRSCSYTGPWFNIKMSSYQYRESYCGDNMVKRSYYLHNGISYTGNMSSLYWIGTLVTNITRSSPSLVLILWNRLTVVSWNVEFIMLWS